MQEPGFSQLDVVPRVDWPCTGSDGTFMGHTVRHALFSRARRWCTIFVTTTIISVKPSAQTVYFAAGADIWCRNLTAGAACLFKAGAAFGPPLLRHRP